MSDHPDPKAEHIAALEEQHLFQNYGQRKFVLVRGQGCQVFDDEGKAYLDFVSGIGVNALGHGHSRILKAICDQVGTLMHCSNLYAHPYQGPLAEKLTRMSGLDRAYFCNSGAEAVETALKIAKGYGRSKGTEKTEIIALNNSFAGRTLGAISVTGQPKYREPFEPLIPGVKFVEPNDVAELEAAVSDRTAAIMLEPILGEGGIVQITREFAQKVVALGKQHDALVIFDEIQSGMGRTGEHFAFQAWNDAGEEILPDVMTLAKPLGGGIPIGAVLATNRASEVLSAGMHGSTFGGNALACRVALEFLDVLEEILPRIRETSAYFEKRLGELVDKYDFVSEVRGRGLMRGLNLTVPGKQVVPAMKEKGFLINCTAGTVLRFLPPYVIEKAHIDQLIGALDEIFAAGPPSEQ
jgi:predicted acetylornithine/succinylornithine family transaminase